MKHLFILLTLLTLRLNAQTGLTFDKRFVESEDKWVAFTMDEDSSYLFGFIYIDAEAGLTLQHEGAFKIGQNGRFDAKKLGVNSKVRLKVNNVRVAFIPESRFKELDIEATPNWLQSYKHDTASVKRLYKWGYMYNGWNECAKGLTFLEKAQKIDPQYDGLQVELAFSYNCLGQYDKAVVALQDVIKKQPTDAYVNKELVYALVKSGQLDKGAESCRKAIEVCTDTTYNGENCYNLLHEFYAKKDKKNFKLWLKEAKKWCSEQKQFLENIAIMEKEMNK
jgi:tetratricopeptide (TPR) repeat protein